ncbi:hypothetical protein CR513_06173, partial [Mucuna pruriens]
MDRLQGFLNSTNHMTSFPSYFTSYLKVSKKQLTIVANGDHVPIVGSGKATSNFSPLYPYTMFFVFQNWLTTLSLYISLYNIFFSHCVIQELTTGRTIGVAKEQGGLYYLQHTKIGNNTNKEDLPSSQQATSKT